MRRLLLLAFMASFPLGLSGCFSLGDSTSGELDQIEFSYSTNCILGCALDQPLMAGTTETLRLKGDAVTSDITVSSSAPEIARFRLVADDDIISRNVEMVTRAPGQVSLQVHRGSELLDQVTFSVREPRAIRFEIVDDASHAEAKSLTLKVGESAAVVARVTDVLGEELLADSGLVWSVDSGTIATLPEWTSESSAMQAGGIISVRGVEPGETTLRIKAGETAGQSLSLKVVK